MGELTVSKISNERTLGRARITYLSACSTAEVKAEHFADEAPHLASAFQVARFEHVICSLWPADDEVCVRVTRLFYDYLAKNGGAEDSNRVVAETLRNAIFQVHSDCVDDPLTWVPLINLGA